MPYIKPERKEVLIIDVITGGNTGIGPGVNCSTYQTIKFDAVEDGGELNFVFSIIANNYIKRKGRRYKFMNDVKGALQGALAEFDRRVVAPYEDEKIIENGDVYE